MIDGREDAERLQGIPPQSGGTSISGRRSSLVGRLEMELPLLLSAEDSATPLLDTLALHAQAALDRALA